jgi:hypothetical protein
MGDGIGVCRSAIAVAAAADWSWGGAANHSRFYPSPRRGLTPDGKRIVFIGSEPSRGIRYYVQNLDHGPPRAITPENVAFSGHDPVTISPDGRFVAVKTF